MMKLKKIFYFSEAEAISMLNTLQDMIDLFGFVSVATYYDIAGDYWEEPDDTLGWTKLDSKSIRYEEGRYYICLPQPIRL